MNCVNCGRRFYGASDITIEQYGKQIARVCETCLSTDTEIVTKLKVVLERQAGDLVFTAEQYQAIETCPKPSSKEASA